MRLVVLMQGVSGSGKSTVAHSLAQSVPGAVIVSADDFLLLDGKYIYDHERVKVAHGHCFQAFLDALQAEVPLVIVDNTNTKWKYVERYVQTAIKHGYEAHLARVECDSGVAALRNRHGVPAEVVRKMANELAEFQVPEGYPVTVRRA